MVFHLEMCAIQEVFIRRHKNSKLLVYYYYCTFFYDCNQTEITVADWTKQKLNIHEMSPWNLI